MRAFRLFHRPLPQAAADRPLATAERSLGLAAARVLPRPAETRPLGFDRDTLAVELSDAEDALQRSQFFDRDTGLLRSELFLDRLSQAAAGVTRGGASFAVLLIGASGPNDRTLTTEMRQAMGHRLLGLGRRADSFALLGQDCFAALLLGNHSLGGSVAMAQKIVDAMTSALPEGQVAAGVVMCPQHGQDPHGLLMNAHAAMTHAHAGAQSLAVFDARMV